MDKIESALVRNRLKHGLSVRKVSVKKGVESIIYIFLLYLNFVVIGHYVENRETVDRFYSGGGFDTYLVSHQGIINVVDGERMVMFNDKKLGGKIEKVA